MRFRTYGSSGPWLVAVHGGPGAPGYMAPVARELADAFRVLEPLQRRSGGDPLTVARHVADLDELIVSQCPGWKPALVGSSWGAMLVLAYAAEHPARSGPLVLIGCGTFDPMARARVEALCDDRMDEDLRRRIKSLPEEFPDPDERLRMMGDLLLPVYSYAPLISSLEVEACDARAFQETWEDMLRLQKEGVYPAAFSAIDVPVLMLHGGADPHPGPMIRDSLKPYLPRLEYHQWERCGHYPWLEKFARDDFYAVLRGWLKRRASEAC